MKIKRFMMLDEKANRGLTKVESCNIDFLKENFLLGMKYENFSNYMKCKKC